MLVEVENPNKGHKYWYSLSWQRYRIKIQVSSYEKSINYWAKVWRKTIASSYKNKKETVYVKNK